MELINNSKNLSKLLIIVGMPGSGKSVAVDYFKQKGWQVIRFGDITIDELNKKGLSINEKNEKLVREEIRKEFGMDAYAKLSLPTINEYLLKGLTVIDGLYSWAEYKFLKNIFKVKLILICIFTSKALRYKRLAQRKYRSLSPEQAELRDIAEIENLEKGGPIAMVDYTIINNSSKRKLNSAIKFYLKKIFTSN